MLRRFKHIVKQQRNVCIDSLHMQVLFGLLFHLPSPPQVPVCYGSLLIELCKADPASFPQIVSPPFSSPLTPLPHPSPSPLSLTPLTHPSPSPLSLPPLTHPSHSPLSRHPSPSPLSLTPLLSFWSLTAFFSYTLGVQDGWLACPFSHILAKSTRSLGLFPLSSVIL